MIRLFAAIGLLFVLSCNTEMNLKKDVLNEFVAAINRHDTQKLGILMTPGHVFITADQHKFESVEAAKESWEGFFSIFPDYKLELKEIAESADGLLVIANASGSLKGENATGKSFLIPMSIKVGIEGNKINEWQVFADASQIAAVMNYAPVRNMNDQSIQGFGGVFFKAKDPKVLCAWYDEHLGTTFNGTQSCYYKWSERDHPENIGSTSFGVFAERSTYFDPSKSNFMFNFRVNNLEGLIEKLKRKNIQVVGEVEKYDYGNFGWIVDPEGNKIELWEPIDAVLDAYEQEQGK